MVSLVQPVGNISLSLMLVGDSVHSILGGLYGIPDSAQEFLRCPLAKIRILTLIAGVLARLVQQLQHRTKIGGEDAARIQLSRRLTLTPVLTLGCDAIQLRQGDILR